MRIKKDAMPSKAKNGAPPIESLGPWLKVGGALSLVAALVFIVQGLFGPIQHLSTYNREQMKAVFASNDTWVVLCHEGEGEIDEAFATAAKDLDGDLAAKWGVLNCGGTLPSGKTVWKRFDLEARATTVFVVGPGLKPVQAPSSHLESAQKLGRWLKATVEPHAVPVATTRELEAKCLNKLRCALILKSGAIDDSARAAFRTAMGAHRSLRFASVDAGKHELSAEKKLGLAPPADGQHRLIYFQKYEAPGGGKPKAGEARWGLAVYPGALGGGGGDGGGGGAGEEISAWLEGVQVPGAKLKDMTRLPTVLARKPPKKTPPPKAPPAAGGGGAGRAGAGSGGTGAGGGASAGGSGGYSGLTKEEVLERFRQAQRKREGEKRAQMESEAEGYIFEDSGSEGDGGDEGGDDSGGVPGSGGGDGGGDWEDDEEVVDLDEL